MNNVMVSVCVLSYNHERYLRQCLDGIFMQKVSFPIEVRVHDDASTDKSQDIIREYQERYPNVLKPILQSENQYSKGGGILAKFLFPLCEGKYIALCEGDDYWTDPLKLQKQVDFLEGHGDYSMCFHRVGVLGIDDNKFDKFSYLAERDYSAKEILENWTIPTASVVFKRYVFEKNPVHGYGDIFLWLQLAEKGKLYCMGFLGAKYRRNENSITYGFKLNNNLELLKLYKFFKKRFPNLKETSNRMIDNQIYYIGNSQYQPGVFKYRLLYMLKHPKLIISGYMTTTLLSYTPLRNFKFWKKDI